MPATIAPETVERLPPRTWRQWWGQTSSTFRSAVWGGSFCVVVHLLLVIRMAIGLQEEPAIVSMGERGMLTYFWERQPERFPKHYWLLEGLLGRSCANIDTIRFDDAATDADLALIGHRCPRLRTLDLSRADITSPGLAFLKNCPRLEVLQLTDTDIDDDSVKALSQLSRLRELYLEGTRVTDDGVPHLLKLTGLRLVDLEWTQVTLDGVRLLQRLTEGRGITIGFDPNSHPRIVSATIRWADSEICERAPQKFWADVDALSPVEFDPARPLSIVGREGPLSRSYLNRVVTREIRRVRTKYGDYSIRIFAPPLESAPVKFRVTERRLSPDRFEFLFPVTRAEAKRLNDQEWKEQETE